MIPWQRLDSVLIPGGGGELCLYRRDQEYSIRITGAGELMNSRVHGSEEVLAQLACRCLAETSSPQVLVGGLGMGFTLSAALKELADKARIEVSELMPEIVHWNRGQLGNCSGHPLADPRVSVTIGDVAELLRASNQKYDAILLDVDNGPDAFTRMENNWLYTPDGLAAIRNALTAKAVLAIWSATGDPRFTKKLSKAGFTVTENPVRARGKKGAKHMIWLAIRSN